MSVEAKHTIHDAWPAFVMNIFEPLTTYSVPPARPLRTAVVWIPETSEPAPGSESPKQPRIGSETSGASHCRFCSSVPAIRIGPAARPFAPIDVPMPEQPQFELLPHEHPVERGELRAAERLRQVEVHQPELVGLGDDVGRVRLVLVVLRRLGSDLLLRELAREGAKLLLLVGERERDAVRKARLHGRHRVLLDVD